MSNPKTNKYEKVFLDDDGCGRNDDLRGLR